MNRQSIGPGLIVADQPTAEDLAALKAEGFVGVVNFRNPGEPDQPLDPDAEGDVARGLGLDYLHAPVGGRPLDEETVEAVRAFLDRRDDGPVLLHCKMGGRAAALAALHRALEDGWSPEEAPERARRDLGINMPPKLQEMVVAYLKR